MTRKILCDEIQALNQRLNLRQADFQLANQQSKKTLEKRKPYLIIATGLLAGLATGAMGWRKVYTFAGAGFSFYPLLISRLAPDEKVE